MEIKDSGERREETALQRQSIQSLSGQVVALHKTLNDIYPLIAGRVIQLRDAGEEKAMEAWNQAAIQVVKVLEGVPEQNIQDLMCQVAQYREVLLDIQKYFDSPQKYGGTWPEFYSAVIKQLLSSPDPGAKVKAVVDICLKKKVLSEKWRYEEINREAFIKAIYEMKDLDRQLEQALTALEGGTSL